MAANKQLIFKRYPEGLIDDNTFGIEYADIPVPCDGEILVKVKTISIDPSMRVWLHTDVTYTHAMKEGMLMDGRALCEVTESKSEGFAVGDLIYGNPGCQEWAVMKAEAAEKLTPTEEPEQYLHVLGLKGLTAYFGLFDIGQPQAGETLVVSTAGGAIGSLVVQMGKIVGCRVVGITGSDEKVSMVTKELGADACINYKTTADLPAALKEACPEGIDVFFDNVGGEQLDAVLGLINDKGRMIACGLTSQYNQLETPMALKNALNFILKQVKYEGYVVLYKKERFPEALAQLKEWLDAGLLKNRFNILNGLEQVPEAICMLFSGTNDGRVLVNLTN